MLNEIKGLLSVNRLNHKYVNTTDTTDKFRPKFNWLPSQNSKLVVSSSPYNPYLWFRK